MCEYTGIEMKRKEKVEELIAEFECNQHLQNTVLDIMVDYPSLIDELENCYREGASKIDLRTDHSLIKPKIVKHFEYATIYINN